MFFFVIKPTNYAFYVRFIHFNIFIENSIFYKYKYVFLINEFIKIKSVLRKTKNSKYFLNRFYLKNILQKQKTVETFAVYVKKKEICTVKH